MFDDLLHKIIPNLYQRYKYQLKDFKQFEEFLDIDGFLEILKEKRFPNFFPTKLGSLERFVESYDEEREFLAQFSVLQTDMLRTHGTKYLIGEGAQGLPVEFSD